MLGAVRLLVQGSNRPAMYGLVAVGLDSRNTSYAAACSVLTSRQSCNEQTHCAPQPPLSLQNTDAWNHITYLFLHIVTSMIQSGVSPMRSKVLPSDWVRFSNSSTCEFQQAGVTKRCVSREIVGGAAT